MQLFANLTLEAVILREMLAKKSRSRDHPLVIVPA